jgi:hypothetical protein
MTHDIQTVSIVEVDDTPTEEEILRRFELLNKREQGAIVELAAMWYLHNILGVRIERPKLLEGPTDERAL